MYWGSGEKFVISLHLPYASTTSIFRLELLRPGLEPVKIKTGQESVLIEVAEFTNIGRWDQWDDHIKSLFKTTIQSPNGRLDEK